MGWPNSTLMPAWLIGHGKSMTYASIIALN